MFGFGFKRKRAVLDPERPTPGDRLVYAIGDVHGRLDLMDVLLVKIARDAQATEPAQKPVLVFLGDYVDRGPASRGVIETLIRLSAAHNLELRALKGNHEQALLSFLEDPDFGPAWVQNGGAAALASYGVAAPQTRNQTEGWEQTREKFAQALPPEHLKFLRDLEIHAEYGDYIFVHAGLRPGVPIARQTEQDMLWIRQEFIQERRPFEKVVVHGHTPEPEPFLGSVRLGVDTGAYATGVLTAVRLFGPDQTILQARADEISASAA